MDSNEDVKVYSEDQFKGLLADKQAEVRKRQSIEAELAELKSKQTAGSSVGDDAPMTVGQFRKMLADQRQADSEARFNALEQETAAEVREMFTAETAGAGLDYDSVVEAGAVNLSEGDRLAIRQAKNPAAERYRRCVFNTPELSEKAEAVRTGRLLENVTLKGRAPATGSVGTVAKIGSISGMSEDELNRLADSLD